VLGPRARSQSAARGPALAVPRCPPPKKGNGGPETPSSPPAPSSVWGRSDCTPFETVIPAAKTCLTRCPAADDARYGVAVASGAAVVDSGLPDRARAVTLTGRPSCKNAGRSESGSPRTSHNSRVAHTDIRQNLRRDKLGAGPRARPPCQRPRPRPSVADSAGAGPAAAAVLRYWPDNAGWPATAANAALLPGRPGCNSGSADRTA
jgi:hypothetical protein